MAILLANDLAISIGQWLPYDYQYYGYYFAGLAVMLVVIVYRACDIKASSVAKRTSFTNLMASFSNIRI